MSLLRGRDWKVKYTPEDGNLVALLYIPALAAALRYDRLTGYFSATALTLAARGIEGLIANGGHMRLVVGCTLDPPEIEAIRRGETMRGIVERHLAATPLTPLDPNSADALELLASMVAQDVLDVKIAIPCDDQRRPIAASGIFHEKAGIIEDAAADIIAFNGSLNETAAGWRENWESLNLFTSWSDAVRVAEEERNFSRLWADQARFATTLDLPAAIRADLLRFLPASDQPARLTRPPRPKSAAPSSFAPAAPPLDILRLVWNFIRLAPTLPDGGERVGEATSAVDPWPHQLRAFVRLYQAWPPRLLIADEVGLGKTIEAGMLIRQAWLAGRAKRVLILVPSAVRTQWQIELREKFNLSVPIYDGHKLIFPDSPATRSDCERPIARESWHHEPLLIVSSQLVRRRERQRELLETAEPWDLIVLDEAHHARRHAPGSPSEGGPNTLLRLMRGLRDRTQGLLLLTATPMQVHPVELWDLLDLLGLPPAWTPAAFTNFFRDAAGENPSTEAMEPMAALFRAAEAAFGPVTSEEILRFAPDLSRIRLRRALDALRDVASIPRRQLSATDRALCCRIMRASTPVARLVSRNTRTLLRAYYKAGRITTRIADRHVDDRFVELSPAEHALYEEMTDYISKTYQHAPEKSKTAIGFLLTIYRRRLASSFHALRRTLEDRLESLITPGCAHRIGEDDLSDDETAAEPPDTAELTHANLAISPTGEAVAIRGLLERIRHLPPDSKLGVLREILASLRGHGLPQAMVFTQFTDTMDFLRNELAHSEPTLHIMCFSGRGGEVRANDGSWGHIGRDEVKRRFREGLADLLLCTDAASEGLNFQFCGALVNYDMPWNPMRVEQRIGRIDRLGQRFERIEIVNLHYSDTVEADIYLALRRRVGLFQSVVGRLQPILARLPGLISDNILHGEKDPSARRRTADQVAHEAGEAAHSGFDLDAITPQDLEQPTRAPSPLDMNDLDRVLRHSEVLPPGLAVRPLGPREYAVRLPGMPADLRISTDPHYVEEHPENVELWSPGNPLFQPPDIPTEPRADLTRSPIRTLLPP